jgi:hypothetical protein
MCLRSDVLRMPQQLYRNRQSINWAEKVEPSGFWWNNFLWNIPFRLEEPLLQKIEEEYLILCVYYINPPCNLSNFSLLEQHRRYTQFNWSHLLESYSCYPALSVLLNACTEAKQAADICLLFYNHSYCHHSTLRYLYDCCELCLSISF